MPPAATKREGRRQRKAYRERILSALTSNGFDLAGNPLVGNESQFFAADLAYPSVFKTRPGLRPHIRVEMSFYATMLKPIGRPIQSLVSAAKKEGPEVTSFPCVDPIETAADKLSTLAWQFRKLLKLTSVQMPIRPMQHVVAVFLEKQLPIRTWINDRVRCKRQDLNQWTTLGSLHTLGSGIGGCSALLGPTYPYPLAPAARDRARLHRIGWIQSFRTGMDGWRSSIACRVLRLRFRRALPAKCHPRGA